MGNLTFSASPRLADLPEVVANGDKIPGTFLPDGVVAPTLASLPEVVANGGKIPASFVADADAAPTLAALPEVAANGEKIPASFLPAPAVATLAALPEVAANGEKIPASFLPAPAAPVLPSLSDSAAPDGSIYLATDHGGAPAIKVNGVVKLIAFGSVPLSAGTAETLNSTSTTVSGFATDANGGSPPFTYQWYRSTTSGGTKTAVPGQTSRTLSDSGLTPGTTYYYVLLYTDAGSSTVFSNEINATTTASGAALAAGTLNNGSTSTTTATAFAQPPTGGTPPYSYQWFRSTTPGQRGAAVPGQTSQSLIDSGLTPGTSYYYTMVYSDSAAPPSSVDSSQVTETTAADTGPHATHAAAFARSGFGEALSQSSGAPSLAGAGSFTIGALVNLDALVPIWLAILSKYSQPDPATSAHEYILFFDNTTDTFALQTTNAAGADSVAHGTTAVAASTWYLVVGVYDHAAGTIRVHVNGVPEGTAVPVSDVQNGGASFLIGGTSQPHDYAMQGRIAMAFKYGAALDAPTQAWLYNGGLGRSTAEVLARAGLGSPDFLYGFDDPASLGADSGPNVYNLGFAYGDHPAQVAGPG